MADIKQAWSTVNTFDVTSLSTLVSSTTSGWQSAPANNTTNLYMDAICQTKFTLAKTNPSADKAIYIYAFASVNTDMTSPISNLTTGSLVTIQSDNNLRLANVIPYNQSATGPTLWSSPFSIAQAFGGILPAQWGLAILNNSGAAMTETVAPVIQFRGVYATANTADL